MPREMIQSEVPPYHVKVGWRPDGSVQVGVEVEGDRSIFWTLFDGKMLEALGRAVRDGSLLNGAATRVDGNLTDRAVGEALMDLLDTVASDTSGPEGEHSSYRGLWATLDRRGCNRLVQTVRRARDTAFGADA